MTKRDRAILNSFIEEYAQKILEGKASLFVGSGFSKPANLPVWSELLKDFAEEIKLDVKDEHDLISLAQYYVNAKKRTKLDATIKKRFSYSEMRPTEPLPNHELIVSLPIRNIWTTNYDQLLEETLRQHNVFPICLTDDSTITQINSNNGVVIHKIHGDADSPEKCVITKSDYDHFASTHEMLLAKLKAEMCCNTFLFLGYSFNDTNIQHVLSRIRVIYGDTKSKYPEVAPVTHYCFFAKSKKTYDNTKQQHHIKDMKSYGIHPIILDNWGQMTDALKRIRNRVCKKNIFISGSYPNKLQKDELDMVKTTAINLATRLVVNNYSIYSGYGMNLGVDVVQGAHDGCDITIIPGHTKKMSWLNNNLHIFPFPFGKSFATNDERKQKYSDWRKLIIEKTQVTILISGKKEVNGCIVDADGVYKEFEISDKQGNLIIPIEFTGGMTKRIWDELSVRSGEYYQSSLFQKLKEPIGIYDTIEEIIEKYALNI